MTELIEKEILDLYFDKMYSYDELIKHFNGKYSYAEIKKVINKRYEKTQKTYF